jgi:hypothetical protein
MGTREFNQLVFCKEGAEIVCLPTPRTCLKRKNATVITDPIRKHPQKTFMSDLGGGVVICCLALQPSARQRGGFLGCCGCPRRHGRLA